MMHSIFFPYCCMVSSLKLMLYYYERNHNLFLLNMVYKIIYEWPFYKLNKQHEQKLIFILSLIYWAYYNFWLDIGVYLITFIYFLFSIHAYFFTEFKFSMKNLLITTCVMKIYIHQVQIVITGGLVVVYICIKFLIFKLDEINRAISINVLWPDKRRFLELLSTYDQLTKVVNLVSEPIDMIIGIIYLLLPWLFTMMIEINRWQPISMSENIIQVFFQGWILFGLLYVVILNSTCAKITYE